MYPRPLYHTQEEYLVRSEKLTRLKSLGINPYPPSYTPSHQICRLLIDWEDANVGHSEDAAAGTTAEAKVAGRLVLFRAMGKNAFGQIQSETARLQVMFNRELTRVEGYEPGQGSSDEEPLSHLKFIEKLIDLGDIIGIEGHLFRTMKGELTLFAKRVTLLCKTLLPLPDKHAGITDKEVRYRKRWLDLISHSDVFATFRARSDILRLLRREFEAHHFVEVETPVLQTLYGGANAKPFTTHLNALDEELYLRISLELPLKKLVVGGIERVYEIGRVFRNEGIDRNHNPEFTLLEAYAAYWDYNQMMSFTERLIEKIALALHGTTRVTFATPEGGEFLLDFTTPWKRMTMHEAVAEYAGIDTLCLKTEEIRAKVRERCALDPLKVSSASPGLLLTFLFEELVEDKLIQPHHITDHPIETTPLCKPHRDPQKRALGLVERFETYILGHELANAYTELNDPVIQRTLLEAQAERRDAGDEEAAPLDEEFIEAICQGMPPTAGVGIGIDRLVMILTATHSIRDVIYFPLMRREEAEGSSKEN